jgi:putative SOS response-associated peptidase YedK
MCGRVFLFSDPAEIAAYTGAKGPTPNVESGEMDVAPTDDLTVLIFDKAAGQRRQMRMKFGLIPPWAKDWKKDSVRTFNAKSETITQLPSFKPAWGAGRRGLVVTNGWYEWEKDAKGKTKQRYALFRTNEKFTCFACIWNIGTHDGQTIYSAAIVTTVPNAIIEPFHNRMPVLIEEKDWPKWLGEEAAAEAELLAMLRPFPPEKMTMTPVKRQMPKRGGGPLDLEPAPETFF